MSERRKVLPQLARGVTDQADVDGTCVLSASVEVQCSTPNGK
jgi:hypothetical protein